MVHKFNSCIECGEWFVSKMFDFKNTCDKCTVNEPDSIIRKFKVIVDYDGKVIDTEIIEVITYPEDSEEYVEDHVREKAWEIYERISKCLDFDWEEV